MEREEKLSELILQSKSIISHLSTSIVEESIDATTRNLVETYISQTQFLLKALFQLNACLDDMIICRRMLSRFPWHGTEITKSKHLELTWFSFQNHCYKFKEKLKLYHDTQQKTSLYLKLENPIWLQAELKAVAKIMKEEIKARGNTVHSWDETEKNIDFIQMLEVIKISEHASYNDLPEVGEFYSETKYVLRIRSKKIVDRAEQSVSKVLSEFQPVPVEVVKNVLDIVEQVNNKKLLTKIN